MQPWIVATFLDSSKRSFQRVLLYNENRHGTVSVGHSTVLKEQQNDIRTEWIHLNIMSMIGLYV